MPPLAGVNSLSRMADDSIRIEYNQDLKPLEKLLDGTNKVWVVGYLGTHDRLQQFHHKPLPLIKKVGQFELFSN